VYQKIVYGATENMNIFVLDLDPVKAAEYQCDKHVVKMILETAQLLSSAHHVLNSPHKDRFYKLTHKNHPCAVWTRESASNYGWLYNHFIALCAEYTKRYGKCHKTDREKGFVLAILPHLIESKAMTPFPLCMPDQYKTDDVVESYRNYYKGEKAYFAKWKNGSPSWWNV
jgi:hypothetical protein